MPDKDLKIALIPHRIAELDVEENLRQVEERLKELEDGVDLVVLPEMFNTGFTPDREKLSAVAETNDGRTVKQVQEWARQYGFAIWGGFTAVEDGNYYNRGFMVNPDGTTRFYDKRHLFPYGGESDVLTRGEALSPIVNYRGWNLKMSICYDIRYPVWNRQRKNDYDALIVPANWVHARYFAWKHMLIGRAIENQCYVLGCNREGKDPYGQYRRGDSMALNNWGDDISDRRDDGTIYALLEAERFNRDRKKFEPWLAADDFEIIL